MFNPIAVSIAGAVELTSLSSAVIDSAIRAGDLKVRRHGNRVLIRVCDLENWVNAMPEGRPAAPPHLEGRRTGRPRKTTMPAVNHG